MLLEVYNPKGRVPAQMFEVRPDKAKQLVIQYGWTMTKPIGPAVAPLAVPVLPTPPAAPVPPAPPPPPAPAPVVAPPKVETLLEKEGHQTDTPIPMPPGLSKSDN
jgi:hypothetical protein